LPRRGQTRTLQRCPGRVRRMLWRRDGWSAVHRRESNSRRIARGRAEARSHKACGRHRLLPVNSMCVPLMRVGCGWGAPGGWCRTKTDTYPAKILCAFLSRAMVLTPKPVFTVPRDTVFVWRVCVENGNEAFARGGQGHARFRFVGGARTGGDGKRLDHLAAVRVQHQERLGVAPRRRVPWECRLARWASAIGR
jgi:hypothetical protein